MQPKIHIFTVTEICKKNYCSTSDVKTLRNKWKDFLSKSIKMNFSRLKSVRGLKFNSIFFRTIKMALVSEFLGQLTLNVGVSFSSVLIT